MKDRGLKRIALILFCLLTGASGIVNVSRVRTVPLELTDANGDIIVHRVYNVGAGSESAVKTGDMVQQINGYRIHTLAEANWVLEQLRPYDKVTFSCRRGDLVFEDMMTADRPVPLTHVVLMVVLGIAFFVLGFSVWWFGGGDSLVAAFLRLNIVTGAAILLDSRSNTFASALMGQGYALGWMFCYGLIPAAFLDFILQFTIRKYPQKRWHQIAVYVPSLFLIGLLVLSYRYASTHYDPVFINILHAGMNDGLGSLLVVYFAASLLLLVHSWRHASRREDRTCSRWLLLCTFAGVAPFIFLYRLPMLWGGTAWISLDQAFIFLIIGPIGWAMAVASFRLLRMELTLSRTLIYVASAGIVIYAMTILVTLSAGSDPTRNPGSLPGLVVVAGFIAYLAGLSLAKGIRGVVDRVYYGDWYSFRRAVRNLSQELASSVLDQDIILILTEKIPDLLHIEKAILVLHSDDERWISPPQRNAAGATEFAEALSALDAFPEVSGGEPRATIVPRGHPLAIWGVDAVLPLVHAGRVMGCLLLGRKDSQSPYSVRDLELLRTLSSFSGMAISNLELHQTLIMRESRAVAADLAGGIAHEINNALYPLKGQAQLILHNLSQAPSEQQGETLQASAHVIVEMSEAIQRIADNLHRLSEPIRPKKVPLNLNDVAESAIRILRETAGRIKRFQPDKPDAPFRIIRNYTDPLPNVEADSGQIGQVFINLILNAADAMESCGRGVLTVGTRFMAEENAVAGYVTDTGIGIRPEHLKKISQPYFTTKTSDRGTGLGLAIVQSIVESHGGKMTISSVINQGTHVEFSLPLSSSRSSPE